MLGFIDRLRADALADDGAAGNLRHKNSSSGSSSAYPSLSTVLHDRYVNAGATLSVDQLDGLRIVSGNSPPCSMVSKRRPVPSICGSCGRFSGVISANLRVSFIKRSSRVPRSGLWGSSTVWVG